MAKASYDFDAYLAEAAPAAFVLKVNKDQTITIAAPTSEQMMELDEATSSRRALKALCGPAWSDVYALVKDKHAEVLTALVRDLRDHFNLGTGTTGGSSGNS